MASLSEKIRQKKQLGTTGSEKKGGLAKAKIAIPAVDAGLKTMNRSSIVNEKFLEIDPKQCRPWKLHNRHEEWLVPERLVGLTDSIQRDGQLQPGLVRKTNDENHPYEIIFGVRRWAACNELGRKFRARITQESDKACIRLMHFENEESKNISCLEQAFAYADQLTAGFYKTQSEFAKDLNITLRHLSRILRIAQLRDYPGLVNCLFQFVDELSLRSVEEIAGIVKRVPDQEVCEKVNLIETRMREESGSLTLPEIIKIFKVSQQKPPENETFSHVYLREGKRNVIEVIKTNNEIKIKVRHEARKNPEFSNIVKTIADEIISGSI